MTFRDALASAELELVAKACRMLRLEPDLAEAIVRAHVANPSTLAVYEAIGETVRDYVAARGEVVRAIRAATP